MRGTVPVVILFAVLVAACSGGGGNNAKLSYDDSSATVRAIAGDPAPLRPANTDAEPVVDVRQEQGARLSPGCSAPSLPADLLAGIETTSSGFRTFILHVPPAATPSVPMPLVMNFHGSSRTGAVQEEYSGLAAVADEHGFLLVSPDGGGSPPGWDIPGVYNENGIDDVEFVMEMLAAIGDQYCLDLDRVYATGHSNGAEMASQLACYRGDAFAAIAPVSGVVFQGCNSGAIPVLSFHGNWDDAVPYDYGYSSAEQWAGFNGCDGGVETEEYSENVDLVRFTGCPEGAEVVFYSIDGGGHTWPGALPETYGEGPTTDEVNASLVMWEFFATHPKRNIPSAYVDPFANYSPSYNPGFEPPYEVDGERGEGNESMPPEPISEPAADATPVAEATPPLASTPVMESTRAPAP